MSEHTAEEGTVWAMTAPPPPLESLDGDLTTDVCVVGAGIAGLSVAYELTRRGCSVTVLDQGPVGGGETSRTTAHLVTALDERYFQIERLHGRRGAGLAAESHAAAIDRIEQIIQTENIECRFARVDGYLVVPARLAKRADELMERELVASTRAGVAAERLAHSPLAGPGAGPCLRFPRQAQFHPMRYLNALASLIRSLGARLFAGVTITRVAGGRSVQMLTAEGRTIRARAAVIATNIPITDPLLMKTRLTAHRTYVIGLRSSPITTPPALFWDGYWDDSTPYHYARLAHPDPMGDHVLIVGGEDHEEGVPAAAPPRHRRLEEWARTCFPQAGPVMHRWSGRILEPDDELAFIGRSPQGGENVFIIAGDSGNGMTYAGIAGLMLPDLMEGRTHRWENIYSPIRASRTQAAA